VDLNIFITRAIATQSLKKVATENRTCHQQFSERPVPKTQPTDQQK